MQVTKFMKESSKITKIRSAKLSSTPISTTDGYVKYNRHLGDIDIFISYNHQDTDQVKAIARKLEEYGREPWIAEEKIIPSEDWIIDIQDAIIRCNSVIIIFGTNGVGNWQKKEIPSSIKICEDHKKPLLPVLLPGIDKIPQEHAFLVTRHHVDFEESIEENEPFKQLFQALPEKV